MVSTKDIEFFLAAYRVAKRSSYTSKHGAIIVRNGCVLSVACNRNVSHPVSARWCRTTLHAEQRAIILARCNVAGSTVYTARVHRNNVSKPCVMCMALMIEAGVRRVVYHDGNTVRDVLL